MATVLDAACGSGGMLSTTFDFLRRKNPYVDVRLFGQEINPESYAICLADMLIKGQSIKNIKEATKMIEKPTSYVKGKTVPVYAWYNKNSPSINAW